MNCGDFRYLIQRRFDVELSSADDRALLIHLEACESCQRFYHQVQQVIIAAEELEMTEDVLPQKPQELFSSILENLPQEKQGMKALVFSFLARLGVVRSDNETGKSELISSMSKPAGPKKFSSPVSIAAVSNKVNEQVEHPLMNWGQPVDNPNIPSLPSSILAEKNEQLPPQNIVPDEQVITRSLSEKFGLSGANSILNNNQPLTLAESIRQKISEMSKTGGDYSSTIPADAPSPDSISQEPMDEWSIPHSPQWPKLTADTLPEQWPNEIAGAKAPNTWGNTLSGWGGQPATLPGSDVSDLVASGNNSSNQIDAPSQYKTAEQEQSGAKPSGWSTEAEQLETGTWQTVKFDTTLGATGYASSPFPPANQSVNKQSNSQDTPLSISESVANPIDQASPQDVFESISHAIPPSIPVVDNDEFALPEKIEIESESFLDDNRAGANPIENVVETAKNDVQSFVPSPPGVPKIYPVVSRRARTAPPYSKPDDVSQPPVLEPPVLDETVNPLSSMSTAPAEPSIPTVLIPPAAPVTLASSAIPAISSADSTPPAVSKGSTSSSSDVDPLVEALLKEVVQLSLNTNIDTPQAEEKIKPEQIEDDTSHLFNFDDGAIDQLFSNNLGVHERSVSTQSTPSAPSFANADVNPPPATLSSDFAAPTPTPSPVNTSAIPSTINASSSLSPPTEAVSTPASTPSIPVEAEAKANSLFAVDDSMIDRIFTDHLGVPEQVSKNAVSPSTTSKSQPVENTERKPVQSSVEQENIINPDFSPDSISASVQQPPAQPASKDAPQFGSTAGYSSGKQKIAGVGRLDTRVEAASDPGSGRIASIGKFLLDNKDLEKIGRITASDLSEGKMRTLTLEANEELKNLLKQIEAQQGVVGTVIVGHDGLLIAHTMSQDNDAESLGVEALAVYMGTLQVVEKLGDDNVRQIVSRTNQGYLIIANFGAGLLVTLTKPILLDGLLPLMRTITTLVAA